MAPTQGSFTMIPMMLVGSRAPPALREPPRERHGVSMTPQTSFSDVLVSRHRRACYTRHHLPRCSSRSKAAFLLRLRSRASADHNSTNWSIRNPYSRGSASVHLDGSLSVGSSCCPLHGRPRSGPLCTATTAAVVPFDATRAPRRFRPLCPRGCQLRNSRSFGHPASCSRLSASQATHFLARRGSRSRGLSCRCLSTTRLRHRTGGSHTLVARPHKWPCSSPLKIAIKDPQLGSPASAICAACVFLSLVAVWHPEVCFG